MDALCNFYLSEERPTTYTEVLIIMSFAPSELPLEGIETDLRREVVCSFSVPLFVLWQKGYTAKLIRTINSVK